MADKARQFRLLLWKDYLIRKRKLITLFGIIWATVVMLSLYSVRVNVDNIDFPTCQFAARALPSAGMLTFLQSFICSVNNDCETMDKYEEIPAYNNSRLSQIQTQFTPLVQNESVIEVAAAVPNALKLLGTMSSVVDEPTFLHISDKGLRMRELFRDPERVKRYASRTLNITEDVIEEVMEAEIAFSGILRGHTDRCNSESLTETLKIRRKEAVQLLVARVCPMSDKQLQSFLMNLIMEVDFSKYLKMLGNMYSKLNGGSRITVLGDTLSAILRMSNLQSFVPPELVTLLMGSDEEQFRYYNLTIINKVFDLYEPTFGGTKGFQTIRGMTDGLISGVQWFYKLLKKRDNSSSVDDVTGLVIGRVDTELGTKSIEEVSFEVSNALELLQQTMADGDFLNDIFDVLPKLLDFILRWLPKKTKHDALFYSTLLAKLVDGTTYIIKINIDIAEISYNVTKAHPKGINKLAELPVDLVARAFDALIDAERTQALTTKLNNPDQMFCDAPRVQTFFKATKDEAGTLMKSLCTDEFKKYINDLITAFGINDVKKVINELASLFIQETLGRDISSQLYTPEQSFNAFKRFIYMLLNMRSTQTKVVDWSEILNIGNDNELMIMLKEKAKMTNEILITVHGCLAKEVVKSNLILDIRIAPVLKDTTTLVLGLNAQLESANKETVELFKKMYPQVLETMLRMLLDEDKTYKLLSTHSIDLICKDVDIATKFLTTTANVDIDNVVKALCEMSNEIEKGMQADSPIGTTIAKLQNPNHQTLGGVDWSKLINGLQVLYRNLHHNHPYVFDYKTYNMDEDMRAVINLLLKETQEFWFGNRKLSRAIQLSINALFRILDTVDRDIFSLSSNEIWLNIKHSINSANSFLILLNEVVKLMTAISNSEESYTGALPPSTVKAVKKIIPNLPQLIVDCVDLIHADNTELEPLITLLNSDPPWPCSNTSISSSLNVTEASREAVAGFEALLCMDRNMRLEWQQYAELDKVKMIASHNKSNPSTLGPHVFLNMSANFDALVRDSNILKNTLDEVYRISEEEKKLTFLGAWDYAVQRFNTSDNKVKLRSVMTKIDTVLQQINTPSMPEDLPLNTLWDAYVKCNSSVMECLPQARVVWKRTLMLCSVVLQDMAANVRSYVMEINEPNASLIQTLGFTKKTGLYILYDKMADFVGVLLNSYWDYGFMNQIRKASKSPFWDCEAVVEALVIPPGSRVTSQEVQKVKPFICPSLFYWLSLPRGENSLLDLVSVPQYFFYTLPSKNLTSNFTQAFNEIQQLTDYISDVPQVNITDTLLTENDIQLDTVADKFGKLVDNLVDWKVKEDDPSYILFNKVNRKKFTSSLYFTKIVSIVSKIQEAIESFNTKDMDLTKDSKAKIEADLLIIQKKFQRRPTEAIALHFDLLTTLLWEDDNFTLTKAIEDICDKLANNKTVLSILSDDNRFVTQICAKDYSTIYKEVQKTIQEDYKRAKDSLNVLFKSLNSEKEYVVDIFSFFDKRPEIKTSMQTSLKYADDLGTQIYLKYLQTNLKHYSVILSFLSGEDWWAELRRLYEGPYVSNFFDSLERSVEIADDILKNADSIHVSESEPVVVKSATYYKLVRLLREINLNDTAAFCQPNVVLSDYIPDMTGLLSTLKQQACDVDPEEVFAEMPIMVIVSQGYDNTLTLSKDVDYTALDEDLKTIEAKLEMVRTGPKAPKTPFWISEDDLEGLRKTAKNLVSKDMIVKMTFGLLSNVADAATLFLNSSECQLCSPFTSWFKQLNLQLYKKQEYDTLLCMLDKLTLEKVYAILTNDFHWDMTIRELISTRNYTKYELNKSVNEFLAQVKLHLLDDMTANETKLVQCLGSNVTRNEFGNATLFIKILSRTIKLMRAQVPHLSEVPGFKSLKFVQQMFKEIADKLPVVVRLSKLMEAKDGKLMKELGDAVDDIKDGVVDLLVLKRSPDEISDWLKLPNGSVAMVCEKRNCTQICEMIVKNIDEDWINEGIKKSQETNFWSFNFIAKILNHFEQSLNHIARLLGVFSKVDITAAMEGTVAAILDFLLQIIQDGDLAAVIFSIRGMAEELHPLLTDTLLDFDLRAMVKGLKVIEDFKRYVVEDLDLKVSVSQLISTPERLEHDLTSLGINNTNFWSIAAPRVHAGYIDFKPLLTTKQQEYRISNFVCQSQMMSQLILPANVDVVTLDDIYGAIIEQYCGLDDDVVKKMLPAIVTSLNYTFVMDKVTKHILTQVYKASNLTELEGSTVVALYPQMAALLPVVHKSVGDVAASFADEPLFEALKDFQSVNGLLSSSDFLTSAGNMLCGKPFVVDSNRLFKAIIESEDFSNHPDPMQLEVLPTDFCKSLYVDILSMSGGKIVWSLIKPLLMGRILYTPPTPEVERIIHQANSSFSQIAKLTGIVHDFAASFPSVHQLSSHRAGLQALRKVVGVLGSVGVVDDAGGTEDELDLNSIFNEFGDLNSIENLLRKASDLLRCVNLNRFHSASSEDKLANEAVKLTRVNEFSAGIVFLDVQERDGLPHNVSYKIRMDIDTVPTTSRKRNQFWTPGPEANFLENLRYFRGFVQIQDLIDNAIIYAKSNRTSGARKKRNTHDDMQDDVYTQEFPYPCYRKDYFQSSLYESQALIVAFFVAFVFSVASAIRFIVSEREAGITVLLSIMGVNPSLGTLSWVTCSAIELSVTSVCVSAVLSATVLPRTDFSLLLFLVLIFCFSHLMFCYMISKMFKSASLASVCGGLLYMVTFMPYVIILALEAQLSYGAKILTCLSMSSAFSYTLQHVGRLEATGAGAHWKNVTDAGTVGEDLPMGHAVLMIVVDAALYFCVGWLIERYTGLNTLQSNITYTPSSTEKAGVSIVNISAVYQARSRRKKVALEQVSIELHKGHVTTLLGHNGAGKTTLIKIITGMVKATQGHVVVRGRADARPRVGLCPQHDVLYEQLTAKEHLRLYAALKQVSGGDSVEDEVERLSAQLSLGAWSHVQARQLSGGLRRRLCVALAFCGAPHVVLLDEPSAGVDPHHRREIWSLIMRLKEDRTVLMTTHLLDEAELLSDQIVIMHKGQVHTTGSPIDIKRTFGNGYTLTASYPLEPGRPSAEDLAQGLLDAARSVVANAQLLEVEESKVEVALPTYSPDGVCNDFLELCSTIEAQQTQLGFSNYSLEGSSLEHALANVCNSGACDRSSDLATKSSSTSSASVRAEESPLVADAGALRGSNWEQFCAIMHKRYMHFSRNKWLLFLTFIVPSLFVIIAMAFSMIRPPADNEVALLLTPAMYEGSTQFVVPPTSDQSTETNNIERVMAILSESGTSRNWTTQDNPSCKCGETRQECDYSNYTSTTALPNVMILPDANTVNQWLVSSQEAYIEKRYTGYSSSTKNRTHYIAWYNNKGHHALPAAVSALNAARFTAARGRTAQLRAYTHPLKISKEQLSKSTLLQHVADAGISGLVLVSWCLVPAGCACLLVQERVSKQSRLLVLAAVPPALITAADLALTLVIVLINIALTACVLGAFGFPVFVARDNLPAICLLLLLYGWSCGGLVQLVSRLSADASVCAMLTFCCNVFVGLSGLAVLLILDIISESQRTDDARWLLHKVLLCAPQFALGDALLEIAKNTVQAQVLSRFGMDTYKSPLWSDLIVHHYTALFLLGVLFTLLNLAIEYGWIDDFMWRFNRTSPPTAPLSGDASVKAERERVSALATTPSLTIATLGNINKGYIDTEGNTKKHPFASSTVGDALYCVSLSHSYPRQRLYALNQLTLGLPRGECTTLLGENGAGKSTAFSILTGSLRPSSGKVYLLDEPATRRDFCSGLISYCPQTDAIDPLLTVRETLHFYCKIRGISDKTKVISRTLETFELTQYASVLNKSLSGGNKRKLCAAIAFMSRCPIILLDEPTSGMDPVSLGCVSRGVDAARRGGATVLLATHCGRPHAARCRLALMHRGELRALSHAPHHALSPGYVILARCASGRASRVWRRVSRVVSRRVLLAVQRSAIHFIIYTSGDESDSNSQPLKLSDIFRLLAELQSAGDLEDYTLNQSSLEQMFLNDCNKELEERLLSEPEPLPTPPPLRRDSTEIDDNVTSL